MVHYIVRELEKLLWVRLMRFKEVNPEDHKDLDVLYEILKERTEEESISHKTMPTPTAHMNFVLSEPYRAWYIVSNHNTPIGSCYISETNEIGIAIFKKYRRQGLGTNMLEHLMKLYPNEDFLANINPKNEKSIRLFEKVGFKHIQNTYINSLT